MNYSVYILYSQKIDKYYTGFTSDVEARLKEHNEPSLFNNWSKQGAPWILKFTINCESKSQAIRIENHIKRNKSRKFVENLQEYPEIAEKLKEKYPDIIG